MDIKNKKVEEDEIESDCLLELVKGFKRFNAIINRFLSLLQKYLYLKRLLQDSKLKYSTMSLKTFIKDKLF